MKRQVFQLARLALVRASDGRMKGRESVRLGGPFELFRSKGIHQPASLIRTI